MALVARTANTIRPLWARWSLTPARWSHYFGTRCYSVSTVVYQMEEGKRHDDVQDAASDNVTHKTVDELGVDQTVPSFSMGQKEYSPEIQELADRIASLNLIEINDLCDLLKDRLGMEDADFFMPMGGGGGRPQAQQEEDQEEAAPVEEKTHFNVKITGFDAKAKIKIIKEVRGVAGLGLKEAKELVENTPATIMKDVKKEEAEEMLQKFKDLGAEVELE